MNCKKLIVFTLVLVQISAKAQYSFPTYFEVLQKFYGHYSYYPIEASDGLEFAKKKEGWYVNIIDRQTEKVKKTHLFWSRRDKSFRTLSGFTDPLPDHEQKIKVEESFTSYPHPIGYYRCPYYGYAGWDIDVIRDFGTSDPANFSDTLLEGMSRAYSAYATRFGWVQYGGHVPTDTTKTKLRYGVLPSSLRVDSIRYFISRSIEYLDRLQKKNIAYQTLVGNSGMKKFNEQVHGYMQMMLAGRPNLAADFLKQVATNSTIIQIARNYLQQLPANSILFTYGDNDTYPLLYAQVKENFRKDVAVINTSLLGFPPYVDMLHRNNIVSFSSQPSFYNDSLALFSLYNPDSASTGNQTSLSTFLSAIQSKKYQHKYQLITTYPWKEIYYEVDTSALQKMEPAVGVKNKISIRLGDYVTLDEFLILDIVYQNSHQRPIYFSATPAMLKEYVLNEGLNVRFLPLHAKQNDRMAEIRTTEAMLKRLKPTSYADVSSGIAPGDPLDAAFYSMYNAVISFHLENKDQAKAKEWMLHLYKNYNNKLPFTGNLDLIAYLELKTTGKEKALTTFQTYLKGLYNHLKKPSPVSYLPKDFIKNKAKEIQDHLTSAGVEQTKLKKLLNSILAP